MNAQYSLRNRLIWWISAPILSAIITALLVSYFFARHEVEEVYDAQLVHWAKVLLHLTQHEILEEEAFNLGIENPDLQHKYERKFGFRIWANERIIIQSENTKSLNLHESPPGFSDQMIDEDQWRVFVFIDASNNIKIEVSELYEIRFELIIQLMASLILPALLFTPVIFVIVWGGVRSVLKPVVKMSVAVDQRNTQDLSPITKDQIPREIAPLVHAINGLFERIEESFTRERQFTDNAAHELRTPLAAIKTQAQVLRKSSESTSNNEGLDNLLLSIDRASHLIDQLLSFTRLQADQIEFCELDFSALVLDVLLDLSEQALKKNIELEASVDEGIRVHGNSHALEIMLRNLVDNAIKFTPNGGRIDVTLNIDNGQVNLTITDTGQGIDKAQREKVFDRFYRIQKNKSGSGLGLSMVKWIGDLHQARVELSDNNPGLIVRVSLKNV